MATRPPSSPSSSRRPSAARSGPSLHLTEHIAASLSARDRHVRSRAVFRRAGSPLPRAAPGAVFCVRSSIHLRCCAFALPLSCAIPLCVDGGRLAPAGFSGLCLSCAGDAASLCCLCDGSAAALPTTGRGGRIRMTPEGAWKNIHRSCTDCLEAAFWDLSEGASHRLPDAHPDRKLEHVRAYEGQHRQGGGGRRRHA